MILHSIFDVIEAPDIIHHVYLILKPLVYVELVLDIVLLGKIVVLPSEQILFLLENSLPNRIFVDHDC